MHVDTLRTMGRAAQGVRLINLKGTAAIAAVARVPRSEDEEEIEFDEDGNPIVPIIDLENGIDIENELPTDSDETEGDSVE